MNHIINLTRLQKTEEYQNGIINLNGNFFASLENGFSQKYVPIGIYEIKKREVLSGLTKRYRKKFDWFDWHLELQDVPNADYVYLHVGNNEGDTDACPLIANTIDFTPATSKGFIGESVDGFARFYAIVSELLENDRVFINIK